jgi:hypothetical protein
MGDESGEWFQSYEEKWFYNFYLSNLLF